MGGLSRRGLFAGLLTAPVAIAAGIPLANELSWWAWARGFFNPVALGISTTIQIEEVDGTVGTWETQGNLEAWEKWQAAHPFGRYKTKADQAIGRARHALLDREIMREHGLPEYQDGEDIMPYMRKALEDAGIYVFPPEQSYGERVAREYYGW